MLSKEQINLTADLIEIDDQVIENRIKYFQSYNRFYKETIYKNNIFAGLYDILIVAPARDIPVLFKTRRLSKKSDKIFKKMGYSWIDHADHFKKYEQHSKKLKEHNQEELHIKFKANLDMLESIHSHHYSFDKSNKTLDSRLADMIFSNKMTNEIIKSYNQIRQKKLPYLSHK